MVKQISQLLNFCSARDEHLLAPDPEIATKERKEREKNEPQMNADIRRFESSADYIGYVSSDHFQRGSSVGILFICYLLSAICYSVGLVPRTREGSAPRTCL